jgi:hypothetical protein
MLEPGGLLRRCATCLAALAVLSACSLDVFVRTDPVGVYRSSFETPVEEVRILGGGATTVKGYDAWLKIAHAGDITLSHQGRYRASDPKEALAAFRAFLPRDRDLKDPSGRWLCLVWTDPGPRHLEGRVLLFKVGAGVYFFRAWAHPPEPAPR